jgi:hypothetical protein
MSNDPKLTIAGDNDLASDTARHAISSGLADPVYLWRTIEDPLVTQAPVVVLADHAERKQFARTAIDSGTSVVSLPFADPDEQTAQAVLDGKLRIMSSFHGLPTIARLFADCRSRAYGRRYGVYAAHRLPRNYTDRLNESVADLGTLVTSLIDSPLGRVSAIATPFGWFILARFDDETIATIEVSALLPEADEPNGELIVEVTGSEAVLRAEPERQSVITNGNDGFQRQRWYADPPEFLLSSALAIVNRDVGDASISALRLVQYMREAAASDNAIAVSPEPDQAG